MTTEQDRVSKMTARYPQADITPAELEQFVGDLFGAAGRDIDGLVVTPHDVVQGTDGTYNFDATVRFPLMGMAFLVLVEVKRHKDPIKRELVQVLHSKMLSVGAQKAVLVSTSPFQSGAVTFANTHGIALLTMTEGRHTFETKGQAPGPELTREQAASRFGLPTYVAYGYLFNSETRSISITPLTPEDHEEVAELLLHGLEG